MSVFEVKVQVSNEHGLSKYTKVVVTDSAESAINVAKAAAIDDFNSVQGTTIKDVVVAELISVVPIAHNVVIA